MGYQDIEDSRMYQRAEKIADDVWEIVIQWNQFAKNTVGNQLVRAIDSIGANIAESSGRFSPADAIRFLHFSRGSLKETCYWIKRAQKRNLISPQQASSLLKELGQLAYELNSYIKYQRTRTVKEQQTTYEINDDVDRQTN